MRAFTPQATGRHLHADFPAAVAASAAPRVLTVQYLRAIAASLVVLHHATNIPALAPYHVAFGTFGVDLFFVISGYIMWATTSDGTRGPLQFWSARILRIVPLYWIFTTVFIAIALVVPSALSTAGLEASHVLKSYLFIPAEHPHLGNISPVYTLGWTLNYEMFFYFVFGVCLLVPYRAARLATLVGTLVLLILAGWFMDARGTLAKTYTDPVLLEFAAGALLAWFAPRLGRAHPGIGWALLGGAIVWLVLVYSSSAMPELVAAHAPAAIGMLAGALVLERTALTGVNPLGLFLGDASYSIYLVHPFGQRIWYLALDKTVGVASFPLAAFYVATAIFIGLTCGAAVHLLLERPIMRAGKRLSRISFRRPAQIAVAD